MRVLRPLLPAFVRQSPKPIRVGGPAVAGRHAVDVSQYDGCVAVVAPLHAGGVRRIRPPMLGVAPVVGPGRPFHQRALRTSFTSPFVCPSPAAWPGARERRPAGRPSLQTPHRRRRGRGQRLHRRPGLLARGRRAPAWRRRSGSCRPSPPIRLRQARLFPQFLQPLTERLTCHATGLPTAERERGRRPRRTRQGGNHEASPLVQCRRTLDCSPTVPRRQARLGLREKAQLGLTRKPSWAILPLSGR